MSQHPFGIRTVSQDTIAWADACKPTALDDFIITVPNHRWNQGHKLELGQLITPTELDLPFGTYAVISNPALCPPPQAPAWQCRIRLLADERAIHATLFVAEDSSAAFTIIGKPKEVEHYGPNSHGVFWGIIPAGDLRPDAGQCFIEAVTGTRYRVVANPRTTINRTEQLGHALHLATEEAYPRMIRAKVGPSPINSFPAK